MFEYFICRTPTFPLNTYKLFFRNIDNKEEDIDLLFDDPVIAESIYWASADLFLSLNKSDKPFPEKLKQSLLSYYARMSTRSTPFGTFSGIAIGSLSNKTDIVLSDFQSWNKKIRLTVNYLNQLCRYLSSLDSVRKQLTYYPNNSIFSFGNKLRYIEFYYKSKLRLHKIVDVDKIELLESLLGDLKSGKTYSQLLDCKYP